MPWDIPAWPCTQTDLVLRGTPTLPLSDTGWLVHAWYVGVYLEEEPLESRAGVRGHVFDPDVGKTVKEHQGKAANRPESLATHKERLLRLLWTEPQPKGVTDKLRNSLPLTASTCAAALKWHRTKNKTKQNKRELNLKQEMKSLIYKQNWQ